MERIVSWSARHPVKAIAGWCLLVVLAVLSSALVTGEGARNIDPGEAGAATRALIEQDGRNPVRESVLIQAEDGTGFREGPQLREAVQDLVQALHGTAGAVTDIASPLAADRPELVSVDGRSALVTFRIAGVPEEIKPNFQAAVRAVDATAAAHPGIRIAQAGDRSLSSAVDSSIKDDFRTSHVLALPISLVILLIVFGSLVAAAIPLVLAATAVIATFGLLQLIDHRLPINSAVNAMVLLIGMAVGIDYCLFYLRREREERLAGRDVHTALRITARTSGRVVLASGITVMLCLAGLLSTGIGVFRGLTVGTVLVVGLTVIGSVSVLPALLSVLGRRVDSLRVPFLGRRRTEARESRLWTAVARAVVRRPLVWGGLATVALLALAVPALTMHPQDPAVTNSLPRTVATVDAAVRMQEAFPGAATPSAVVIWHRDGTDADTPAVRKAIDDLKAATAQPGGLVTGPVAVGPAGRALVVRVPLAGSGTDNTSVRALAHLRDQLLPATIGRVPGVDFAVGGRTATAHDFAKQMTSRAPLVFVLVLVPAFILLVVTFRSLTIPVISILLNLLSIGAAYGVLTWIFQDGHLTGLINFTPYGGVVGWLPLFMFVILFGLSMDYHIFILSRIRERWAGGATPRQAIVDGVAGSAGVVTSAAAIMTAVFAVFVILSAIEYKMLGIGMAAAIVIDATVVRGVLLPASVALLGVRAWPTPRWLGRLPGHSATTDPEPTWESAPAAYR